MMSCVRAPFTPGRCIGASLLTAAVLAFPAWAEERRLPDPHGHVPAVQDSYVAEDPNEGFRIAPGRAPATPPDETAASGDGSLRALAVCDPDCRVVLESLPADGFQELVGPSFSEARPFSGLAWVGGVVVFDQWFQPHHGTHYAVDVKSCPGAGSASRAAPLLVLTIIPGLPVEALDEAILHGPYWFEPAPRPYRRNL